MIVHNIIFTFNFCIMMVVLKQQSAASAARYYLQRMEAAEVDTTILTAAAAIDTWSQASMLNNVWASPLSLSLTVLWGISAQ